MKQHNIVTFIILFLIYNSMWIEIVGPIDTIRDMFWFVVLFFATNIIASYIDEASNGGSGGSGKPGYV